MCTMSWAVGARALVVAWLISFATAQVPSGSSVSFAYPPKATPGVPSLLVNVLDTVVVQWTSNFDQAWIYFYCNSAADGDIQNLYAKSAPLSGQHTWYASEQPQFTSRNNWTSPIRCWFDLNWVDKNAQGLNGPVISVTSLANKAEATTYSLDPAKPTSSSASPSFSTTSSPTGTSPTGTSPTGSQTSATSPSNASSGNGGLSGGAIAGIVIGAIAGVLVLAGLLFVLYRNHRKMKDIESKIPRDYSDEYKPEGVAVAPPYAEVSDQQTFEAPPHAVKYAYEAPPASPRELDVSPSRRS